MNTYDLHLPENHQFIVERFITACQADERIVAAFLGGSYAAGEVDQYSDLDLLFITTDEAYKDFLASKESFIRLLGEPLFLEDFGAVNGCLTIYSNGTEADIFFYQESKVNKHYKGPHRVLVDKKGILTGQVFSPETADPARQIELLRQQIDWFWHDLSHFIKAMGRRQLWFAYGELEILRQYCVNLARLKYNFSDPYMGETYFKIDSVLPAEQLAPVVKTICPLEYDAMLQACLELFDFYQSAAPGLAGKHGVPYQVDLERIMIRRLKGLDAERLN